MQFAVRRVLPDRRHAEIALEEGSCTVFDRADVIDHNGLLSVRLHTYRPLLGRDCTNRHVAVHVIALPRPAATVDDITGGCTVPAPNPLAGISMCEYLHTSAGTE